jgi:phosphatidate phosphatase APP1
MNLRKFSWTLAFFKPADTYKMEIITQIIDAYPERRYICVGDSGSSTGSRLTGRESFDVILGELDPEIYGRVYAKYPQNIAHIFIRDISTVTPSPPTAVERFVKALEGVPSERWTVFREPNGIETNVERMIV